MRALRLALWLATLVAPAGAMAAICNYVPEPDPPIPEITITKVACQYLARHQMAANAEYEPGVDVEGRAVVAADLPDTEDRLKLPETITVEIAPALAHWLPNQDVPYETLKLSRINLGTVSMTGGVLTFNGQPLGSSRQDELLALCLEQE